MDATEERARGRLDEIERAAEAASAAAGFRLNFDPGYELGAEGLSQVVATVCRAGRERIAPLGPGVPALRMHPSDFERHSAGRAPWRAEPPAPGPSGAPLRRLSAACANGALLLSTEAATAGKAQIVFDRSADGAPAVLLARLEVE
jgi:hypothetical protein